MNLNPSYDIVLRAGAIDALPAYISSGKLLVITDDGLPQAHIDRLLALLPAGTHVFTVKQGEGAKSLDGYAAICEELLRLGFHRDDMLIAFGGGVVGDLTGFVAATYMRGISFINIPTTALSQIDSSIGGKTAINFCGTKNVLGCFHQPRAVLVDTAILSSLPARQLYNGLVEALKAGLIYDSALFEIFESLPIQENINEIIRLSLLVKKDVVEKDEKEQGLRKILNFGHTIGHGLESSCGLLHGEAVAYGMLCMIDDEALRARVKRIIQDKLHINAAISFDKAAVLAEISKDKKADTDGVTIVTVNKPSEAKLRRVSFDECISYLDRL
ncbi:MAG: 3-dehydroquinate synthase [Deferribacteraceae bacterium]|nr:3-dehydroquinate synthase [Deferribacteraceae bacterium]